MLTIYSKGLLIHFELTNGRLLGNKTENASSNYSMIGKLQSTLGALGTDWPAMRNHIPCVVHVNQLALDAFMISLGVKGHTKSWKAHECDQQYGENGITDSGMSQRLRKVCNARITEVLAMRPGLAKIIEKVHISRHFGTSETNLHIAENAYWINYTDTWSLKLVQWLAQCQMSNPSTTSYGLEHKVQFDNGVAWASQLSTRIQLRVAQESKIQWLPDTLHNTGWMDNGQVCHGSFEAIPILDPVDVNRAYSYYAPCHHSLWWHVWLYRWRYASFT